MEIRMERCGGKNGDKLGKNGGKVRVRLGYGNECILTVGKTV